MGKFEITRRKNGEFQFNLKDRDGHVILTSEGYTTKENCIIGIASVKKNCLLDERYERLISADERPYFNIKSSNGQVVGTSMMHETESDREADINLLKKIAPDAEVIDLTFEEREERPEHREPKKVIKVEHPEKAAEKAVAATTVAAAAVAAPIVNKAVSATPVTPPTTSSSSSDSTSSSRYATEDKTCKKGCWSWMKYILPLLALLLIGLFAWKSCCKEHKMGCATNEPVAVVEEIITMETDAPEVKNKLEELCLPNDIRLNVVKNGIEDQLVTFLLSDEYKNVTNDDLKNKWFRFDNVEFKFNSGTELLGQSHDQLHNIVEIIKYFKNTKFKIGAYTDKIGTEAENLKISQERANTIKSILIKDGLKKQIIGAEGYGEKFAIHNEKESDTERAHDRIVALRLEK